jgi:serine/threonine protein kinase
LHGRSILHRDVKAENYFFTVTDETEDSGEDGVECKLGDFGESALFEIQGEEEEDDTSNTPKRLSVVGKNRTSRRNRSLTDDLKSTTSNRRMTIVGTPTNMAPELINAASSYTEAVDIYSLGVTLWEMWGGGTPFSDLKGKGKGKKGQKGKCSAFEIYQYVSEEGGRPTIPAGMHLVYRDCVERAWAQDAGERPSASDLYDLLEEEYERVRGR